MNITNFFKNKYKNFKYYLKTREEIKNKRREFILCYEKPWKSIFLISVPTIIDALIISIYPLIDKLIATWLGINSFRKKFHNQLGDNVHDNEIKGMINIIMYIADVILILMIAFSFLISSGTAIKFSIVYGRQNKEKMSKYVSNGIFLVTIFSIFIIIIMHFFIDKLINFELAINGKETLRENHNIIKTEIKSFLTILTYGLPLLFINQFFLTLFRSEGRVLYGTIISFVSLFINIIFDIIFVKNFGIEGTAWATAISWTVNLILIISLLFFSKTKIKFQWKYFLPSKALIFAILLAGSVPFSQYIAQGFWSIISARILNNLDTPLRLSKFNLPNDINLKLYGAIMPWIVIINAPIIGIARGAKALVGYAYGRKDYQRIKQLMKRIFIFIFSLSLVSTSIILFFGVDLTFIFGLQKNYGNKLISEIRYMFIFFPLITIYITLMIYFQSTNKSKLAIIFSFLKYIVISFFAISFGYLFSFLSGNSTYYYKFFGLIELFTTMIFNLTLINWKKKPKNIPKLNLYILLIFQILAFSLILIS
jgi:Na+-driven multidrug efflux pump